MEWEITDINAGIGYIPGVKTRFDDPAGLLSAMDTYHISHAVVFHTDAQRDAVRGNALALEASRESGGRLSPCYILRPDLGGSEIPSADVLYKQLQKERPAAVKLYPNSNGYVLDEFYAGELLDVLNQLRLPVLLDTDQKPPYDKIPALAKSYPGIKFVILRQPINQTRFTRALLKKTENVYFDASIMIDTSFLEEAVEELGSGRVLFGSGMPLYLPAGSLGLIIYSRFSDADKTAIFSGNWRRIQEEIKWA
jgi:predicted TIM-barrel fold metal-dependent hydrolase